MRFPSATFGGNMRGRLHGAPRMTSVYDFSARTIDGYRDALFEKLNVKSRVGLVLYAIKNNIVNV
jgi:hypothetical protein